MQPAIGYKRKEGNSVRRILKTKQIKPVRGFVRRVTGPPRSLRVPCYAAFPVKKSAKILANLGRRRFGLLLLALFLFAGVLLGFISEADGHGRCQERQGEHHCCEFFHYVSPLGCDELLVWDNDTQWHMNWALRAN